MNTYGYVGGNPLGAIDPLGLVEIAVDKKISLDVINRINNLAKKGGGVISVPDLLKVLNFPPDVAKRINEARGDVSLQCPKPDEGSFFNEGKKINEDIPGAGGVLALELEKTVKGDVKLHPEKIVLDNLKGITADGPGPFNFELDTITVTPGIVDINL